MKYNVMDEATKGRVVNELEELSTKIEALGKFVNGTRITTLSDKSQSLLKHQYEVMQVYRDTLKERLALDEEENRMNAEEND